MLNDKQIREEHRRRDTGSGLSWKLLPPNILGVVFNDHLRKDILGMWSSLETWRARDGVGVANSAHSDGKTHIIALVCREGSTKAIYAFLEETAAGFALDNKLTGAGFEGGVRLVDDLVQVVREHDHTQLDTLVQGMQDVLSEHIYVGTVYQWEGTVDGFVNANKGPRRRYLLQSESTADTGQTNVLLKLIPTSRLPTNLSASHPRMVAIATARAYAKHQTENPSDPFIKARVQLEAKGLRK